MNQRKINIIILLLGVLICLLGLWGWFISELYLNKYNLKRLAYNSLIVGWRVSVIISFINMFRLKSNAKDLSYWLGFILILLYALLPVLFIAFFTISYNYHH